MKAMDPAGVMENPQTGFPQLLGRAAPAHRLHSLDDDGPLFQKAKVMYDSLEENADRQGDR